MDASLIPAIQIDETVTARRRTAEHNKGEPTVKSDDCPCVRCHHVDRCRDEALACERFVMYSRSAQPHFKRQMPEAAQIPSHFLYRKFVA